MKTLCAAILSITLMFSTGYARDIPDILPPMEVTGLVTGAVKSAAILNDRIVRVGDLFEVVDGKLGLKMVRGGRVKIGPNTLTIKKITDKGITVLYIERELVHDMDIISYKEEKFIPLKSRPKVY